MTITGMINRDSLSLNRLITSTQRYIYVSQGFGYEWVICCHEARSNRYKIGYV